MATLARPRQSGQIHTDGYGSRPAPGGAQCFDRWSKRIQAPVFPVVGVSRL